MNFACGCAAIALGASVQRDENPGGRSSWKSVMVLCSFEVDGWSHLLLRLRPFVSGRLEEVGCTHPSDTEGVSGVAALDDMTEVNGSARLGE